MGTARITGCVKVEELPAPMPDVLVLPDVADVAEVADVPKASVDALALSAEV
jgi:hypothetical protein